MEHAERTGGRTALGKNVIDSLSRVTHEAEHAAVWEFSGNELE
jgi:hypothetical protein